MAADMVEFNHINGVEDDYNLEDFFPKSIAEHLQPFIEYRIKVVMKEDLLFLRGESQLVNTSCVIKRKNRSKGGGKLSMHLVPCETLPLSLESGGYIDTSFKGRIVLKLTNYSGEIKRFCAGTPVAYIVLQPFSLE